ncbi:MAG: type II toxin-antitoxin system RelE/ParE family toxin [Flavobacteriales bacterium]|jgi:plasmid stabilization system protein ParE
MPKAIIWSRFANQDLEQILDYLRAHWDDHVADNFMEVTFEMVEYIGSNPKLFPVIFRKLKVRKCVLTKHNTLFYRETAEAIEILRIFDTRQNPSKLKLKAGDA